MIVLYILMRHAPSLLQALLKLFPMMNDCGKHLVHNAEKWHAQWEADVDEVRVSSRHAISLWDGMLRH